MYRKPVMSLPAPAKFAIALVSLYVAFVLFSIVKIQGKRIAASKKALVGHRKHLPSHGILNARASWIQHVSYLEYKDSLPALLKHDGPHFVLFTSGTDDGTPTGATWCSDCAVCTPAIRSFMQQVGGSLLEVHVGTSDEWKAEDNPLRLDEEAPLTYIPTLVHWGSDGPGRKLVKELNRKLTQEELHQLLTKFLHETGGGQPAAAGTVAASSGQDDDEQQDGVRRKGDTNQGEDQDVDDLDHGADTNGQ